MQLLYNLSDKKLVSKYVCMLCYISFREPQSSLATEVVSGVITRSLVNGTDRETIYAFIANLKSDDHSDTDV